MDFNTKYAGVSSLLEQVTDFAKKKSVNIGTQGFFDAMRQPKFKEAYTEAVMSAMNTEDELKSDIRGYRAQDIYNMKQLIENVSTIMLKESIGSISPVVPLSSELQYVNWIRNTMKHAIPVEIPKTTEIVKQEKKKYVVMSDGTKYALPDALDDPATRALIEAEMSVPLTGNHALPVKGFNLVTDAGGVAGTDQLSTEFYVESVRYVDAGEGIDKVVRVNKRVTRSDRGAVRVSLSVVNGETTIDAGMIFVYVDFESGLFDAIATDAKVTEVNIKGYLSSENNMHSASVKWETEDIKLSIPAGKHMNSGITHEELTDFELFYNVDQTKEKINQMSDVLESLKDSNILTLLDSSYLGNQFTDKGLYLEFSLTPPDRFDGDDITWRSTMLKDYIFRTAVEMKKVLNCSAELSLVANPSEIGLLKDLNWVWRGGDARGGIQTNSGLALCDHNGSTFRITTSERVKDNRIRIYLIPMDPTKETYKLYQHSTYISQKYNNPNNPSTPNIMITDRYLMSKQYEVAAQIKVIGTSSIFRTSES